MGRFICIVVSILFLCACADPKVEVPKLTRQLSDSESSVRNKAALELASFGEDAAPAVPKLIRLLKDDNGGVRSSAAYALRSIGGERAEKALDAYNKKRKR